MYEEKKTKRNHRQAFLNIKGAKGLRRKNIIIVITITVAAVG